METWAIPAPIRPAPRTPRVLRTKSKVDERTGINHFVFSLHFTFGFTIFVLFAFRSTVEQTDQCFGFSGHTQISKTLKREGSEACLANQDNLNLLRLQHCNPLDDRFQGFVSPPANRRRVRAMESNESKVQTSKMRNGAG